MEFGVVPAATEGTDIVASNAELMAAWGNRSGVVPYNVEIARDGYVIFSHPDLMIREILDENILPLFDKV